MKLSVPQEAELCVLEASLFCIAPDQDYVVETLFQKWKKNKLICNYQQANISWLCFSFNFSFLSLISLLKLSYLLDLVDILLFFQVWLIELT